MNGERTTEMTRDVLLYGICPMHMIYDCCNNADTNYHCDDCKQVMNEWLDEYDKQIRTEAIDDFVKTCEDYQFSMYGQGYLYIKDIKEIAKILKEQKNEQRNNNG